MPFLQLFGRFNKQINPFSPVNRSAADHDKMILNQPELFTQLSFIGYQINTPGFNKRIYGSNRLWFNLMVFNQVVSHRSRTGNKMVGNLFERPDGILIDIEQDRFFKFMNMTYIRNIQEPELIVYSGGQNRIPIN